MQQRSVTIVGSLLVIGIAAWLYQRRPNPPPTPQPAAPRRMASRLFQDDLLADWRRELDAKQAVRRRQREAGVHAQSVAAAAFSTMPSAALPAVAALLESAIVADVRLQRSRDGLQTVLLTDAAWDRVTATAAWTAGAEQFSLRGVCTLAALAEIRVYPWIDTADADFSVYRQRRTTVLAESQGQRTLLETIGGDPAWADEAIRTLRLQLEVKSHVFGGLVLEVEDAPPTAGYRGFVMRYAMPPMRGRVDVRLTARRAGVYDVRVDQREVPEIGRMPAP
jgi:hypothetical protein